MGFAPGEEMGGGDVAGDDVADMIAVIFWGIDQYFIQLLAELTMPGLRAPGVCACANRSRG